MLAAGSRRLLYRRCAGCHKRRLLGKWWLGYPSRNGLPCDGPAALLAGVTLCADCALTVSGHLLARLRDCLAKLRLSMRERGGRS